MRNQTMRYATLFALVLVLIASAQLSAQEAAIQLTTPRPAKPAIADYRPQSLTITVSPAVSIVVALLATDDTSHVFVYPCGPPCPFDTEAKVRTLIGTLNTVNLSTRSLWRRIFDRLLLDFPERFPGGAIVQ